MKKITHNIQLKMHKYVHEKRYTKLNHDLKLLVMIFLGMAIGSYLTTTKILIPTIFAATSPWTQTDWSGGTASGTVTSTVTTYESISNVDATTTTGQLSLTEASGWSSTYDSLTRRKEITVTNSGSAQTDYQIRLEVAYDSDMLSDFDDIRFANSSGDALDYWIHTKTDSDSAVVWVEADSLADSGDTTLYMYYGNSGVSDGSNGEDTFLLFDDFNDGTVDTAKWVEVDQSPPGEITESDGKLKFTRLSNDTWNKTVYSHSDFTFARSDLSFEMDYAWTNNNSSYDALMMGWHDNTSGTSYTNLVYGYYNSGSGTSTTPSQNIYEDGASRGGALNWTLNQDYDVRVRMRASGGAYYDFSTDGGDTWTNRYTSTYSTESNLRPGWAFYSGTHEYDNAFVRKWMSTEPTSVFGSEVAKYESSGTVTSNILDAEFAADWGTLTYTTSGSGTVTVKVRTDSSDDMSGATAWGSCSGISSSTDLTSDSCVTDTDQYLQYEITLEPDGGSTPVFEDISIAFTASDQVAPTTNASNIAMSTASSGGRSLSAGDWNNGTEPYFSWDAGADNVGGNGLKGYCAYLGTDSGGDPATTAGLLTNTPVSTSGSTCGFIVSGTSLDLSDDTYLSSALSSGTTYYINLKAIDLANNIFSGSSVSFNFVHDSTIPTNVAYISTPGSNFSNVVDMSFAWPNSGGSGPSDDDSGVLGYQYQIGGTDGTWKGTSTDSTCGVDYIPQATGSYTLTEEDDGESITEGNNIIYFRTVDTSCNSSSVSTYRTGNLAYAGAAPAFETSCEASNGVTVSPTTSSTNSFSLSWEDATAADGQSLEGYFYMINTTPPSQYSTITSNTTTYIDNGTSTSVSTGTLTGAVKGSNSVYVVAVDDADNYSASNCLKGEFTLDSNLPDPPKNLSASDASIKSSSLWRASLGWDVPDYTGTGALTYKVQRSTDSSNWTDVTTTTGTSYIDTVSDSSLYYWRVGAYDTSSESQSAPTYATAVSLTPKGTYTEAADLSTGPSVSSVTTKKAVITWGTSRASDSKVSYGTSSGSYFTEEPSNSTQSTDHTINLTGLEPGTTYYYKAKWTDEDGNTGTSTEKTFTTDPAPTVTDPKVSLLGIDYATLDFTVTGAEKVSIYFGETTAFGGLREISTSTAESTYSVNLTGLEDGTKYYYKINTFDTEDEEYEGNSLTFETLPRPEISTVRVQQVKGTAQPTVLVTWDTNTEVSSIVTYYPEGSPSLARDEVNVALTEGEHRMIVRGLQANTVYSLTVKGRDKLGNEAVSDVQRVTTATDTRPPVVSELKVEGSTKRLGEESQQVAQLVVSWNTDEASTSQIEYGEGTGSTYSQKTQEDSNKTFNHLVVITGLTPSKVYHLRALSVDESGNVGNSIDTVTITPKATRSALDLVITNLSEVFGFLR